jgi:hypothetical protein
MSERIRVCGGRQLARAIIFLWALACISASVTEAIAQESNLASDMSSPISTATASTPSQLQGLVQEAPSRSPVVLAARSHWQAQTKLTVFGANSPSGPVPPPGFNPIPSGASGAIVNIIGSVGQIPDPCPSP